MTISLPRRGAMTVSALALSLSLAACGGSDSGGDQNSDPAASAPSDDDLASALLTSDDVPDGYTEGVPDETTDNTVFDNTCLADVADFKEQVGSDPVSEAKTEFTLMDDSGQAQISATAASYDDAAAVTTAFGAFYDSVKDCTSLSFTDGDGIAYAIAVAIDDTVTLDGADQQLTVTLDGTVTVSDQQLPVTFMFLVSQDGAATSSVGTSEIGGSYGINDEAESYAQTQADRLAGILG